MEGAGDIIGISLPFAAGVAAGAVLFPSAPAIPTLLPAFLAATLPMLAALAALRFDSRTNWTLMRTYFAATFFLAGLSCSLNATLTAGIPTAADPLSRLASSCVESLRARIEAIPYSSATTAPLVNALLTGDRSGLDKETIGLFRASGASHILALSGLHLGIMYLILIKLTAPLGRGPAARVARCPLVIGASGFFTIMTGASPSIVRAFLFIAINEVAKVLGRERDPVRILLAALTVQLALKPEVVSSLGFQLSYLAMAGLLLLYPRLEGIYPESGGIWGRLDPFRRIWKAAMASVSCQIFTAPLAWRTFHAFPKYFLLTNLVALPLTSAAMVLSVATVVLSPLRACPPFLVILAEGAVQMLVYCLQVIATM